MNQDLKQLIRLQTIDLAIQELRARIDRFPGISEALDEKLKSAQAGLQSVKDRTKTNQGNRKKLEGEISSAESKISRPPGRDAWIGRRPSAPADDGQTTASRGESDRVASLRSYG